LYAIFWILQVWTETSQGVGTVNFITGVGGFLQAVFFGYGGIRLKLNQLEFNPQGHLPDQATKFIFRGIKYQGLVLDFTVDNNTYEIFVRAQSNIDYISIVYEHGDHRGSLKVNDRLSFPVDTRLIIRRSITLCP
jgi:trehalose/maltose hydrolase-like predicted phosphorylase